MALANSMTTRHSDWYANPENDPFLDAQFFCYHIWCKRRWFDRICVLHHASAFLMMRHYSRLLFTKTFQLSNINWTNKGTLEFELLPEMELIEEKFALDASGIGVLPSTDQMATHKAYKNSMRRLMYPQANMHLCWTTQVVTILRKHCRLKCQKFIWTTK